MKSNPSRTPTHSHFRTVLAKMPSLPKEKWRVYAELAATLDRIGQTQNSMLCHGSVYVSINILVQQGHVLHCHTGRLRKPRARACESLENWAKKHSVAADKLGIGHCEVAGNGLFATSDIEACLGSGARYLFAKLRHA